MSGHSKWSTIKRQKQANDASRGKLFSKLSRAISIAVKTGRGASIDSNFKLRMAVEAARNANMPKETIERAISRASEAGDLLEVTYEGFGPGGSQLIIEAATDNRNRTAQELKSMLERSGGNMGGPGTVAFNFKPLGEIVVLRSAVASGQMLSLIDLGVEDMQDLDDGNLATYVPVEKLYSVVEKVKLAGFNVVSTGLVKKPISIITLSEVEDSKLLKLVEDLEDHEDVQNVFVNVAY